MNIKCKLENTRKGWNKEEKKLATEIDALTTLLFQGGGRREGVGQTIEKINYVIK